jgi:hypothetical protein
LGGKRTDAISERDLEVLEFVARFGLVPRRAVGLWAGTGEEVTWRRERRLRKIGFLELVPHMAETGPLVICTREGLRACARTELATPRYSPWRVPHSAVVARLAAKLELGGARVLSERELAAREGSERRRLFSAELSRGRFHRPDLVIVDGGPIAVEVELAEKAPKRLDEILRGWRRAVLRKKVVGVSYRCGPRARRAVERAMARTRVLGKRVRIEDLG